MPLRLGGLIILWAAALLGGCGRVSVIEAPFAPAMPTSGTPQLFDLAITSVDFDPALQGNQLSLSQHYTVLAAVENRGRQTEYSVAIQVQLVRADNQRAIFSKTVTIPELAPGTVTVVKLGPEAIPRTAGRNIRLIVKGISSGDDGNLGNNQRDFLIQIAP